MDLDFLYDNYIWIIIVGVILLMALIGFIAEKTNFGKEQFKKVEKKPKNKKGKKEIEKLLQTVSAGNYAHGSQHNQGGCLTDHFGFRELCFFCFIETNGFFLELLL